MQLLLETLQEEKATDEKLSLLAEQGVAEEAASK
jgi:ferritin-like metal-binding protein YciE